MGNFIINGKSVIALNIGGNEVVSIGDGQNELWEKEGLILSFTSLANDSSIEWQSSANVFFSLDLVTWEACNTSNAWVLDSGETIYFQKNDSFGYWQDAIADGFFTLYDQFQIEWTTLP